MFDIRQDGGSIVLVGRFDASQKEQAKQVFDSLDASAVVDFSQLDYISSAGLGLLFGTQKRLVESGGGLTLINLSPHIREIFQIAGFDNIFEIVD